jgi:hypothetical protein
MVRDAYLNWLEDECFFSLCCRQHGFWANSSARETLALLFGVDIQSYAHDFPAYLNSLNLDAVATWGNAEVIINQHTIAPFFFPFQSTEHIRAHKEAMKGDGLGSIKYKLGLITGRFGSEHPLKACSECILEDRRKHGVAYWHLSHQLPGVTTCAMHDCLLKESTINRQWSRAFSWELPSEKTLINTESAPLTYSAAEGLKDLSVQVAKFAELGATVQFEPSMVSQVYRTAITLMTPLHDKTLIAADFMHHCKKLREHPLFSSLPCSNECAMGFISQMKREPRGRCHPLKHLVFISWLFGSFESFFVAYGEYARENKANKLDDKEPTTPRLEKKQTKGFISRVILRPKKVFVEVKEKVLASLTGGSSKKRVCEEFGISISTINRILRLNPLVAEKISIATRKNSSLQKRKIWRTTAFNNPELSIKGLRKMIPDIYIWLYRNDRHWLKIQRHSLSSRPRGNNSTINWDDRDKALCERITGTIVEHDVASETPRKHIFYELVSGLYSALESKSHYPKTRKLLDDLTKSGEDGITGEDRRSA